MKIKMGGIEFLGKKFKSPIFLAASPITSTTAVEYTDTGFIYNEEILKNKIQFLLNYNTIGAIILKTVYYPESKTNGQPNTRVWRLRENLFNTGHTPKEMLSPSELSKFLEQLKGLANRLIISIGVKSCNINLWRDAFRELFGEKNCKRLEEFDVVEINARHTLREINMLYLDNRDIDEYVINPVAQSIWNLVFEWFVLLNELGKTYQKRVLIKLPFRSDLLTLCSFISKIIKENKDNNWVYGIKGVTLINTIKSPIEDKIKEQKLLLDGETIKLPQLSGESLKGIRNWAIRTVKKRFENIEISACGGLNSKEDIELAYLCGATTFQLCTSVILGGLEKINISLSQSDLDNRKKSFDAKIGQDKTNLFCRRIYWEKNKCSRCGNCLKLFYCDAFLNKYLIYSKDQRVPIDGKEYYIPSKFFPYINPDYCTGCGLCIQLCPTNALHYENYEVLLVSSSQRRKRLLSQLIGMKFLTGASGIDEKKLIKEKQQKGKKPEEIVQEVALEKARSYKCKDFKVIIGADTLIEIDNEIIGKPEDEKNAREILRKLSGKKHNVFTGIAVIDMKNNKEYVDCDSASVTFKYLPEAVIDAYIKSNRWRGKAGGYNIEEVKSEFIAAYDENNENVIIGLPLEKLKKFLKDSGITLIEPEKI
ncbi:MAG: Maf family nucleotide pyrophosphatase [Bacteroidales bacterium]